MDFARDRVANWTNGFRGFFWGGHNFILRLNFQKLTNDQNEMSEIVKRDIIQI